MTPPELQHQLADWVRRNAPDDSVPALDFSADTDLIGTGILDSVAFLQLLGHLESLTGEELDLADADPVDFTTLAGLARLAARKPA